MEKPVAKIVIVGGGTAGWITACLVAAEHGRVAGRDVRVVLIESPDVPTIGVGEGTWPSMRATLKKIRIDELALIRDCDASFKQGTHFIDWTEPGSSYLHPFSLPAEYPSVPLTEYWLASGATESFAEFVTPQADVINAGLAPKQASMPPYAFAVNYGYHFDAGKFAALLHRHAVNELGVEYVSANVEKVEADSGGDIAALGLDTGDRVDGDLFVDCTGQKSLLLGGHYGVGFTSAKDVLFNDRAIAVQVPHEHHGDPVASVTRATAVPTGWIWDIALSTRRGIGHVYSSALVDDDDAMVAIREYVGRNFPKTDIDRLGFRVIPFEPGYRDQFWVGNCVAVGLSGGFIEPLEASALALIEQGASILSRQLPANREVMRVVAKRYNAKMLYHWERVIEFLKLHYALSRRDDSEYWREARKPSTFPENLADQLTLWQQQPPWHDDAPRIDELFPPASYQYVLYGMGFRPRYRHASPATLEKERSRVDRALHTSREQARQMLEGLPKNRELLDALTSLPGVA